MAIKICTWNLEHASKLLLANPTTVVLDRRRRVQATIEEIDPDILCIQEGPRGESAITKFCQDVLGSKWLPVLLQQPGDPLDLHNPDYLTKGTQWIWFCVRAELTDSSKLQSPMVWQSFTTLSSWPVHLWGQEIPTKHSHYRHPQVLLYELDAGRQLEIIGVHLKSKINQLDVMRDGEGNLTGGYVQEALEARIKLATEARDVRLYLEAKFDQAAEPGLIVLGDCNDGPGQDFFENGYLFFDLVGNLHGDVVSAERYFSHVLLDFPAHLRWTARFRDEILDLPASRNPLLLDHILLSQALLGHATTDGGRFPLVARSHSGKVEHEAFERHNAGAPPSAKTSDHRPVSVRLEDF